MASVLLLASQTASALGWARAQQAAVLGQPLDFSATLRLDPGDSIAPECVSADVHLGDQRWSAGGVRVQVDSSQPEALVMRVTSASAVDEPVVAVTLLIGCPARMSRRFVLLADPPGLVQPITLPTSALAQAEAVAAPRPATAVAPAAPSAGAGTTLLVAAKPKAASAPVAATPAAPRNPARATDAAPPVATQPATPAASRAPAPQRALPKPAPKPKPKAEAPAPAAVAGGGRLKLDLTEPAPKAVSPTAAAASAVAEALEAVAQAASAARAAANAASEAQARVVTLEKTVSDLRVESKANRDLVAQMRARLTDAEGGGRWLLPLLLAVVALAGVAGWLAWKLRSLQSDRQASWRRAAAAADTPRPPVATSQLPLVTSEIMPASNTVPGARPNAGWQPMGLDEVASPAQPVAAAAMPAVSSGAASPATAGAGYAPYPHLQPHLQPQRSAAGAQFTAAPPAPAVPPAAEPTPLMERTLVLPPQALSPPMPGLAQALADDGARDVSIEELLDLEQQAEFFIVLGQEEAAIDLLVDHLRDTGGGSPLPYLKLLEIYRRRGDRDAYERTRTRFNHRFNAYAPDWDTDLTHGRSLDDYPGVLPRLQQVWPRPLDAMAELEALLFRKSRGELFDLPAYREVLFLYSLSRDLLDREAVDTGNVDLLLPLAADGSDFGSTSPNPYFGLERDSVFDALREDRPTVPVDLDLTQPDMPLSIMDALSPRR